MNPDTHLDSWLWLDGRFVREREAAVSPLDRGFQFGDGLFETIRMETGRPLYLKRHLERLERSLADLRISVQSPPHWHAVLVELAERNGAAGQVAAAKIIVTRGVEARMGLPRSASPTLCCFLRPFAAPGEEAYECGIRLHLFREGHAPFTARHKSLSYLFFQAARQAALDAGRDESILMDHQGRITEASMGSLLFRMESGWVVPRSPHRLPGTTLDAVRELIEETGQSVRERPVFPRDLEEVRTLWVLNALVGIMPAREVDGKPLPELERVLARKLRNRWVLRGR